MITDFPKELKTTWFSIGSFPFEAGFLLDQVSMLLVLIVTFIATLVLYYSIGYMAEEKALKRYYSVMCLFVIAMVMVVLSSSLLQLYFFWELVGVSSYLLIGYWYEKDSARRAARKAFTIIIIGDAMLAAGIILLFIQFGTFNILQLISQPSVSFLPLFLIFGGVASKSAQFPLHIWLPDAMEGPTPVSTLLHSATMVKAGVFLVARLFPLFALSGMLPVILVISLITILLSSFMALVEDDIKRVLAYSTISQLGLIALAFGLGSMTVGLFHLFNHAFFKALLFMISGIIIHQVGTQNLQEIRLDRNKNKKLFIVAVIGVFGLAGVPPLNGFWSKELIVGTALEHNLWLGLLMFIIATLSALYIFRWLALMFFRKPEEHGEHHESREMHLPTRVLAPLVALSGFMLWGFFLFFKAESPGIHLSSLFVSLASLAVASFLAYNFYLTRKWDPDHLIKKLQPFYLLARNKFYIDQVLTKMPLLIYLLAKHILIKIDVALDFMINTTAKLTVLITNIPKAFDRYVLDFFLNLLARITWITSKITGYFDDKFVDGAVLMIPKDLNKLSDKFKFIQTGRIQTYATSIVLGLVILVSTYYVLHI